MLSSLHGLLFDATDTLVSVPRFSIDEKNHAQIGEHALDTRRALHTAIEVIAGLAACARTGETPPELLEGQVTTTIETLHQFVLALDDVEDFAARVEEQAAARH